MTTTTDHRLRNLQRVAVAMVGLALALMQRHGLDVATLLPSLQRAAQPWVLEALQDLKDTRTRMALVVFLRLMLQLGGVEVCVGGGGGRTPVLLCVHTRCAVLCCAVLCCAVLCCAVLCCAVLCCAGAWQCSAHDTSKELGLADAHCAGFQCCVDHIDHRNLHMWCNCWEC